MVKCAAMRTGGFSSFFCIVTMFIGGSVLADDVVGIMRIAVPSNIEAAVATTTLTVFLPAL